MKPISAYFTIYNVVSLAAWLAIFLSSLRDVLPGGFYYTREYSGYPHKLMVVVQVVNAAVEIGHSLTGLVPSPLASLLLQFFARLVITVGISYYVPESPGNFSIAYFVLTVAWSLTEIVRYAFYLVKQVGKVPPFLLWLRYLSFIIFYPLGLLSEPVVVYKTLDSVLGFYWYFLAFGLLLYLPGFYILYGYMWRQRLKYLTNRKRE